MNFKTKACLFGPRRGTIKHAAIIFLACVYPAGTWSFLGCAPTASDELERALALYRQNQLNEALPLFEQAVAKNQSNAEAHAWLAETYRRLGKKDEAVKSANRALALDPCQSFAHTVLADVFNPTYGAWESANSDSTWRHLQQAVACDTNNGNAWVSIWSEAVRRGELPMMKRALRSTFASGFFTRAALAYNRWMLLHLPENTMLVTNGDMDTYPAVALQEAEAFRADVAVVNRSLLNTAWYARFIRAHYGLVLPLRDSQLGSLNAYKDAQGNVVTISDQILHAWLKQKASGDFARPIAFSVTVDPSFTDAIRPHLQSAGPYSLWRSTATEAAPDTALLRSNLTSIHPEDFAGPFADARDRSSVRQAFTMGMATNVTAAALLYSDVLIKSGSFAEAQRWLSWAEAFEKKTEFGPAFTEQIRNLKDAARRGLEKDRRQE